MLLPICSPVFPTYHVHLRECLSVPSFGHPGFGHVTVVKVTGTKLMKMEHGGMTMIPMTKKATVRGIMTKTKMMKTAFGAALEVEDAGVARVARAAAARAAKVAAKAGRRARDTDVARVTRRGKC